MVGRPQKNRKQNWDRNGIHLLGQKSVKGRQSAVGASDTHSKSEKLSQSPDELRLPVISDRSAQMRDQTVSRPP